jgi:hypothetical protein
MRPALDPIGHRVPQTKPTCLLHTWRPHRQRPFALVLHLYQHESSRNLHLQYLAKNQSTERCQSLITQGSDHPPVLEPHMVLIVSLATMVSEPGSHLLVVGSGWVKDRMATTEGGSEYEPVKILLKEPDLYPKQILVSHERWIESHQSPRQQGYGSTSSLRNDSLKHTRKHERRKERIEARSKTARLWRTVRPGGANCPHEPSGPSAKVPRTVRTGTADRPAWTADCPLKTTEPTEVNPEKWTVHGEHAAVRQAPADCPPGTRGPSETLPNQNTKTQQIESEAEQEHEEHTTNTHVADRPPPARGLSTPYRHN